ncbi:c-type cytochrome [Hydrogenimonas cancrithermarum]|uniref:Cytochrome c domain-containing protein n=1 Tax=Hydrogenimonas cancrithermarum TaxID=2993563 RepID=A0ABN6WUY9_9BACT|nr:c-type cytochrome [Hydrogenimonas cancrithermarum]BDY12539.1 hypothetical protein HCR_08510 [Hydrogenimonas cancrithermarum]
MKRIGLVTTVLASVAAMTLSASGDIKDAASLYKERCANCHGVKANGVPKIKVSPGIEPHEADAKGIASEEKLDIYGPPLNHYTKDELLKKLFYLRHDDFDSGSSHSIMRKNLKEIEKREGAISDEQMADYIYNTFGRNAK